MNSLSYFNTCLSILGTFFALRAWIKSRQVENFLISEKERLNKKIIVKLQYGSDEIKLPVDLRREEFSRAEVLGRLGMIPMKETSKRFSIDYLHHTDFFKQISLILEGNDDAILIIPCKEHEFNQFNIA